MAARPGSRLLVNLVAVDVGDDAFKRLHRETRDGLFLGNLQAPFDNHAFLPDVVEPEFDLSHDGVHAGDLSFGVGSIQYAFAFEARSCHDLATELKRRTVGSWMKAPPLAPGGRSPVAAYLRHSMMVY